MIFIIVLFEMDFKTFLHWERIRSCSALGGVDKLRERSLALYEICRAKGEWKHRKSSSNRGHFLLLRQQTSVL